MAKTKAKIRSIDEYINKSIPEAQSLLREIRSILKKVAPNAEEKIKWGQPVLEEKRILFSFSAYKTHINFMPTRRTLDYFRGQLKEYKTGMDTIQFEYGKPLPKKLIKEIAIHRYNDVIKNEARWM